LETSLEGSTQAALHTVRFGGQTHAPWSQISFVLQAVPHPPQLAGSLCSSVQVPAHDSAQLPPVPLAPLLVPTETPAPPVPLAPPAAPAPGPASGSTT
jgi:hypothetical protein